VVFTRYSSRKPEAMDADLLQEDEGEDEAEAERPRLEFTVFTDG